jgi:hypothetical protein
MQEIPVLQEILAELKAIRSIISIQERPSVKRAIDPFPEDRRLPLAKARMVANEKRLILEAIKQLNHDNIVATRKSISELSGIDVIRASNRLQSLVSDGLVDSDIFESRETAHKVQSFKIGARDAN